MNCKHPPNRYYSWFAPLVSNVPELVDTLVICCCDCGAILKGGAGPDTHKERCLLLSRMLTDKEG